MQTTDAASRQVDGRCLVSIFLAASVPAATVSPLAVRARNRQSAEPFYRTVLTLGPQGEFFALDFVVYAA